MSASTNTYPPKPWKARPVSQSSVGSIDTPQGMFSVSVDGLPKRSELEAMLDLIAEAPEMAATIRDAWQVLGGMAEADKLGHALQMTFGKLDDIMQRIGDIIPSD